MRGLADSGQANIAQVQSQTAYGETISGLYGQKQQVEQQAVQQRQLIEQNVAAATEQVNIQRGQQQLQSDTQLFEQVQAIDDNKKAQVASLVELSMSGQYSQQQLQQLADAYGVTEDDLTTIMNASSYFDPTGELSLKESWDWGTLLASTGVAAAGGFAVGGLAGAALGALAGFIGGAIGNIQNTIGSNLKVSGGGREFTGTRSEVITQINEFYSGMGGSDQISADVSSSLTGMGDTVVFRYKGQEYKTYNEALAAYRASQ